MATNAWWAIVGISLLGTAVTFWGIGGVVHYGYYVRRRDQAADWKIQPKRFLGPRLTRHAFFLGSANILMGSVIAGTFAWLVTTRGVSLLYVDAHRYGLWYLPVSAVLLYFAIDAGLYYSHRALHQKTLFRHIHRWHHRYVAPVIFTTTAVHPVEFLTFEFFLILPAFLIPTHVGVYLLVIAYTYLIGMIDHAGVRLRIPLPLHSNNQFHDDHHVYFHCNYGHHTDLFDRLHATVRVASRRYDETTFGGRGAEIKPAPSADPAAPSDLAPTPREAHPWSTPS